MGMVTCNHCLLEVPERGIIAENIGGEEKVFCCHGCSGVYRLIHDEGLDEFYTRRESSWEPGPPEESAIDTAAFSGLLKQTGDETEADILVDGVRCASCVWLIEKILSRTDGVTSVNVNYANHKARIKWKTDVLDIGAVLSRVQSIGYAPKPYMPGEGEERLRKEQRALLIRFGTAAFFSMQLMMYSVAMYAGYFQGMGDVTKKVLQGMAFLLATPVFFYSGMPFIRGSVRGLRNLNLNMDVLIVTGAGAAYFYSTYQIFAGGEVYFDTTAMIITLILLGRYMETGAKGRASDVVTKLLSLNPAEARLVNDAGRGVRRSRPVPIHAIQPGDHVALSPGDKIPLDGQVVWGESEVDESMLSGESKPVPKKTGDEVFCGTRNLYGSLIFQVKKTGGDTVLSHIIRTIEDAQARRAPVQALADRIVGYFVPAVLLLSLLTGIMWLLRNSSPPVALMNAVSVLVIACPCALGLATPLAILTGTTLGASRGILLKGGDVIERAKNIDTVVLDKTGTLTRGRQELQSVTGVGIPDEEALCCAASLEIFSEHSVAKAIVHAAENRELRSVTGFIAFPGRGVRGEIDGKTYVVGNRDFIEKQVMHKPLDAVLTGNLLSLVRSQETSGMTVVFLSSDQGIKGILAVSDTVRQEAGEAVDIIKKGGHDVFMVTGDNRSSALTAAREVNIGPEKVLAQRLPGEKIREIERMQEKGRRVMMVGDGMNDGPALIQADVGVSMGKASDIALESADIVLMKNDLRAVPLALRLSRKIYRIVQQNLFWAFVYNLIALPIAVSGLLHPILSAAAMTLSSLSVVGNSLRLKKA